MANERLERLKKTLKLYYDCEEAILLNQEYSIGSRSMKRADLGAVREAIKDIENEISAIENRGNSKRKVARIIPRDF